MNSNLKLAAQLIALELKKSKVTTDDWDLIKNCLNSVSEEVENQLKLTTPIKPTFHVSLVNDLTKDYYNAVTILGASSDGNEMAELVESLTIDDDSEGDKVFDVFEIKLGD